MAWPSDLTTVPINMQGTTTLADSTDDHALMHRQAGSFINAAGSKLGIGSGTPAVNQIMFGQGGGSAAWGTAGTNLNFGSSTFNNGTIGTTQITGGTIGTATVTGGLVNANWLAVSGGSVNVGSASAPSANQILTATTGSAATWQTPKGGTMAQTQSLSGTTTATSFQTATGSVQIVTVGTTNIYIESGIQCYANSGTTEGIVFQLLNGTTGFGMQIVQGLITLNVRMNGKVSAVLQAQAPGTYTFGMQFKSQNTNLVTIEQGWITAIAN